MTISAQCPTCKHYKTQLRCAAYTERIPDKILDGGFEHTKPFPGDHGIRFEPIEDIADENEG